MVNYKKELYVRRRAEMLAEDFIKALIEVEKREVGRNIDDPVDEESWDELRDLIIGIMREFHDSDFELEQEFSVAFFRVLGFYPGFYWNHINEYEDTVDFDFTLEGVEGNLLTVQVSYDREVQEGQTFIDMRDEKRIYQQWGCIRSIEDQLREEVLGDELI